MSLETGNKRLNPQNPWPGLDSFNEDDSAYFHGRDRESQDLLRLVKRELLTVLFGRSGLGKTSLLRAGLFPMLRGEGFLPVYLRLDFSGLGPSPRSQILTALHEECKLREVEAPSIPEVETLWEFFHRRGTEFWSARNKLVTPLIVLDQFEEAFTIGHKAEMSRSHVREFLDELGDLIENRPPKPIKDALDNDPELDLGVDYRKSDFKIIVSFREDYLPHFEELKRQIPSLTYNRYRLLPMNGLQAEDVVLTSGGALLEENVAARIIGIAADAQKGGVPPTPEEYEDLEIDPALLSVICSELNHRRQVAGMPRISNDLILGAETQILSDFYQRSLQGLDQRVREFVEDELLTDKGYRDSYAYDDALGLPGVTQADLEALVSGRLLRVDDRFGVRRLELTHDVLTHVVKESRDNRKAREAEEAARVRERKAAERQRRNRIVSILLMLGVLAVGGAALLVSTLWKQVDELNGETLQRAKSLYLSQAKWFSSMQYDLGLLLNVEAYKLLAQHEFLSSSEVKAEFADMFQAHPYLDGFLEGRSPVMSMAYSPDGQWVASGGGDGTVTLWDAKARKQSAKLAAHKGGVLSLAFSRDGKWLATAGQDLTVVLWNVATRQPVFPPLAGHRDRILGLAFSRDGSTLVSAGYDGLIFLWKVESGEQIAKFSQPGEQFLGVDYSPTDPLLALACADKTVKLLDAQSGQPRTILKGHEDRVYNVVFSPNGTTLASSSEDRSVILWDVANARAIGDPLRKHQASVWGVAFSPDGRLLATSGGDGKVILWVLNGDRLPEPLDSLILDGHQDIVRNVSFGPDGKTLASGSDDHNVILWNLEAQKLLTRLEIRGGPVWGIAFSPDGKLLATASENQSPSLWDPATGNLVASFPPLHTGPIMGIAFSPDGKRLASVGEDNHLILWEMTGADQGFAIKGKILEGHADDALSVAFSPDGKLIASGGKDGAVLLWDVQSQTCLGSLNGSQEAVRSVVFSPDGKLLAAAGDIKNVTLWELAGRRLLATLQGHEQRVYDLGFAPDGRLLASAGQDGRVMVWDVASLKLAFTLAQEEQLTPIRGLDFGPQGDMLVSTGQDGSLQLWNLPTRKLLTSLRGHRGRVLSVAFSPDGNRIASAGVDETVTLWNWNVDEMAQTACRVANRNLSCSEWEDFVGAGNYRKTCDSLPIPSCP